MPLATFLLSAGCDGLGACSVRAVKMVAERLCNTYEGQIVTEDSPQKSAKNISRSITKQRAKIGMYQRFECKNLGLHCCCFVLTLFVL